MKVLHVVPTYVPAYRYGGPIYAVHGLCKALAARGHDVHVFTTNVDGRGNSDVPLDVAVDVDGVKVWYFPSKLLRRLYWSPRLTQALKKNILSFDLIHLHSVFLWPTSATARLAERAGVPYVVSPRGMLVKNLILRKSRWTKSAWLRLIERRTLANAAALHLTTNIEAVEAEKLGLRLPRAIVVPNGVDAPEDGKEGSLSPKVRQAVAGGQFILFLGRVNWEKGLDRMIPALAYVPKLRLLIAGNDEEGYQPDLEKLAVAAGVADRIRFLGPVLGVDKWALLQGALSLVLPSYSENFGIVVLEAMAVGCPVVVTPEVGLAEAVREWRAGIVTTGDPKALGTAIGELARDHNLREQMGRAGKALVQRQFTWDIVSRQMEKLYEQILTSNLPNHGEAAEQKEAGAGARNIAG